MIIKEPQGKDIPALRALWQQAFGDSDEFLDGFFSLGFSYGRGLWRGDALQAALYWFDCRLEGNKLAYLYAVATEKAARGQGLCRALMENTHGYLRELGYAGAVLVPGNEGLFRLYEKLGYRAFCPMETVTVTAGAPVAVQTVSPEEYAAQRERQLPVGAVEQRGNALAFLQTFARFYRGEGCLFCAGKEKDTVYFQEYLGDRELLAGVTAALGGTRGVVRLPGGEQGFAMYLPLTENAPQPAYFGLPLD